jgi:hypothetical protein
MTTRRDVLRLAAAGAAAAVPVGALAAYQAAHPDAEIFRLAEEIERQIAAWKPKHEAARVASERFEESFGRPLNRATYDEWKRLRKECGAEALIDDAANASDDICWLETRLHNTAATTLAGLAAKARIMKLWTFYKLWDADDREADWDDLATRRILDELMALAGTEVPPMRVRLEL